MRELHVSRAARRRYRLGRALFGLRGTVVLADLAGTRRLAARMNEARARGDAPGAPTIAAGELGALGLIHEIFHHVVDRVDERIDPGAIDSALDLLEEELGPDRVERVLGRFAAEFPDGAQPSRDGGGRTGPAESLEEMLLLALTNENPAAEPLRELFDAAPLASGTDYPTLVARLEAILDEGPPVIPGGAPVVSMLREPTRAAPTSLAGQLRYIREHWADLLRELGLLDRILLALDTIAEEERALHLRFGGGGPGRGEAPDFAGLDAEPERFSWDSDWMPRVVLISKSTFVWLDQLSRRYSRDIRTLDAIPDEELDRLASWGVTGLWLIGLWERSKASQRIKQLRGNPEAVASAYSLDDYRIADDLGGEDAFARLKARAADRGIRLASDMVPNHMGIDSRWVIEHPEWFLSLPEPPYPAYSFNGPDLSSDERVGIFLEDHYYDSSDAAVVFRRHDRLTGESRYVYHGNDGTSFPWNDTAQLDYLRADVREAVIRTIVDVARRSPIIRFDAAMVLAKKHIERLWYPEPGSGGAIPSRAEHAIPAAAFHAAMPREFWREVVDRVAEGAPDTLLLAEAFWLLEGYFVRTLGMHRVYNSAFMHMLRDEDNAGYRRVMKDTLEFDPEILKRYVNFMSNPDERTAVEQFGKDDKYFGVATLLATLPGLPMLGHGQVEGFTEKYGMEFRRASLAEQPDPWLVERHEREIFPLLHRRAWFAGADDFTLFDFVRDDGSVDENVFAYTNGSGATRSLVVYHNRFGSTAGRVRESAAFAVKRPDGSKVLQRRTLRESLAIEAIDPDRLVAFRDARSGLEYLRSAGELAGPGLWVQLDAYKGHVFWEFREIHDPVGVWRRLADHLGGRGVASLDDALREQELEPVHAALGRLLADPRLVDLVRQGNATDLDGAAGPIRSLAERVAELTGASGNPDEVASAAVRRLGAITAGWAKAAAVRPSSRRPRQDPVAGAFRDPWHRAVLAGWAILEALGRLAGGPVGETSRAWFDELRLRPIVANGLADAGLEGSVGRSASDRIRTLLALPRPSNVGGRTIADRAGRLVEAWLGSPELRGFLQVNTWEGTEWFGREEWRELLDWALLLDRIDGAPDASAVVSKVLGAADEAGYRVDRLRELIVPPRPARRPSRPKEAAGRPKAAGRKMPDVRKAPAARR